MIKNTLINFSGRFGRFSKNRIESFSDSVFATLITFLALDLKFAHIISADSAQVWKGIISTLPKVLIWMNSFFTVCIIWMNHQRLMNLFKHADAGVFWLNNILLLFTSVILFPTTLLGEYSNTGAAACFYGICLGIISLPFVFIRIYALHNRELLIDSIDPAAFKKVTFHIFYFGPLLYWVGAALSLIRPWAGFIVYFFIPVFFIFPRPVQIREEL